ncbi:rhodanese-like domain-containing protein [Sedimenticola thiotaurini]|uniref:Rhodanese domain-containing protein n=1 Tax=Sedimenticola thiotaurini TaxID=1543721 RepID=A0A0F7K218_9GAMM|nr:rhodanese-like domain-containing protein [Sedimenticola thiotaurini]AKH20983.1 hypothetical protein AAY24_12185 [Sedimenticola thiotaurini]
MKKQLFPTGPFLVACLLMGSVALSSQWETVSAQALIAWLDTTEPPLVLDVRGRAAYHAGTIPGALNGGLEPKGYLPDGSGGALVLLTPEGADHVLTTAWVTRLVDAGHQVRVLQGGLAAWLAAGGEMETPEFSYTRPGSVPFLIPRGLCEGGEPAHVFE